MKVSIIVPVYNAEIFLDECLSSIQNQTFTDWECVLMDDGSTDRSGQICDEWAKKDSRFIVFHKPNEGAGVTRAKGLRAARGEYVLYADNDDLLLPEMVETLVKMAEDNNADSAICSFYRFKENKQPYPFDEKLPVGVWEGDLVKQKIAYPLISGIPSDNSFVATIWRMLLKRDILSENNITFTPGVVGFPDDLVFSFEYFLCSKKVAVTDKPLYMYRWNTVSSVSCSYNPCRWEGIQACYDKILSLCKKYNLPRRDYEKRAGSQFLAAMSVIVKQEVQFIHLNGYRQCKKNIKEIIYNPDVVREFGQSYVKEMAFQMRLFHFFSKYHLISMLIVAIWAYLKLGMEK